MLDLDKVMDRMFPFFLAVFITTAIGCGTIFCVAGLIYALRAMFWGN